MILITIFFAGFILFVLIQADLIWEPQANNPGPLQVLLLMCLVSALMGLIAAFTLSRIPLKPVNHLIAQIDRLASGDFTARLRFSPPIEHTPTFQELSDSFNKMANELEHTEMLRSDFINNFSHEFKTPIVSITGFAKLLKKGNLSEAQKREYLDIIEAESLRLSNMATNVLNLTQVENLSILTNISAFNLSEQLRSCILLFESKWEQKGISFDIDFDEYEILANEELLKQVWINLLDNALKFSPPGGRIQLRIQEHKDKLTVAISNTGLAIPPESQNKIFNKFYQADESHSAEGNGIGLAIVKKVMELHHGSIFVQSEKDYTTFIAKLPKIQPKV